MKNIKQAHLVFVAALALVAAPAPAAVTTVSYWRFGDNDPGAVPSFAASTTDPTGGRTMTLVGGPFYDNRVSTIAAGRTGSTLCMEFFNTTYGKAALIPSLVNNFGIELWVNPSEVTATTCLAYNGNTTNNGWGIYKTGATYQGRYGLTNIGSGTATAGTWTHLALVRESGYNTFYVNGVNAGSSPNALDNPAVPAGSFAVGAQPQNTANDQFGAPFGFVDEVRVFTFADGAFTTNDFLLTPQLPIVTTLAASGMSNSVATLNGKANLFGLPTLAWFEWNIGPFNFHAHQTTPVSVSAGQFSLAYSTNLSGFTPGLLYHGRAVVNNSLTLGNLNGNAVLFGSPAIRLNGGAVLTNECHSAFNDPAIAFSTPLDFAAGSGHGLVAKADGRVTAWGDNSYGQASIPAGLSNVLTVAAGGYHSLAVRRDGSVAAWGLNTAGQTNVPAGLSNVVAAAGGNNFSLVLKSNGTVAAWGNNGFGQLNIPVGLTNVVAVATGYRHSLALKSNGGVAAWGNNGSGQLNIPAGVTNATAVAAGDYHSLAIKSDYKLAAWGRNVEGQLNIPASVSTWQMVAVAAGTFHSLALGDNGLVVAWGDNTSGQTNVPAGLTNVVAIAAGGMFSMALKGDGTVVAWGSATNGETSVATDVNSISMTVTGSVNPNTPGSYSLTYTATNFLGGIATPATRTVVVADTLPPVITILGNNPFTNTIGVPFVDPGATNLDACGGVFAMTTNGTVNTAVAGTYAVRYSATDNYGHAATNTRTVVVGTVLPTVTTLAASAMTGNLATLNGTASPGALATTAWFDWGTNAGIYSQHTAPVALGSGTATVAFSNNLIVLTPGRIYHFRAAASNALGVVRGSDIPFGSPTLTLIGAATITNPCSTTFTDPGAVAAGAPVTVTAASGFHSLGIRSDGSVVAWGYNFFGQTNVPANLSNVVAVDGGNNHSLALKRDGTVVGWGDDTVGEATSPPGLSNVVAISAGASYNLALKRDGTIVAWGNNNYEQTNLPASLSNNVAAISAGSFHGLALRNDGTVAAWGNNSSDQTNVPAGLNNITAIAAGGYFSLALKSNSTVVAWGNNADGATNVPAGLSNVVAVSAGTYHALALKSDGTVVAWGDNSSGQTNLPAGLTNVTAISGGSYFSLALKADGTVVGWGENSDGQITIPASLGALAFTVSGNVNTNSTGSYPLTYTVTNNLGGFATATRTVVVICGSSPTLTGVTRVVNGPLQFAFTNPSGVGFTVLASTNVALPLSNWTILGAPSESPAGQYHFTDPQATNNPLRFYRVRSP